MPRAELDARPTIEREGRERERKRAARERAHAFEESAPSAPSAPGGGVGMVGPLRRVGMVGPLRRDLRPMSRTPDRRAGTERDKTARARRAV
jgi:hypothetical protein